jgi:hypothetical protein
VVVIYIHAGHAKAASTTIQNFLWTNSAALERQGLIYPRLFDVPVLAGRTNPRTHNALAKELNNRGPGPAWERLKDFLRERAGQNVLLSGENFSASEPDRLRAELDDQPVKVLFYVKDLAKTVVSYYAQRTKTGKNTDDFDAFFDTADHRRMALPEYFAGWVGAFGAPNIAVRLLDERTLAGGDVRLDVLDAAGLSADRIDRSRLEMTKDSNVSPGWKTLEILRHLRKSVADDRAAAGSERRRQGTQWRSEIWERARLIERSLGLTAKGNYLTEGQFALCAERFNAQVDTLANMRMDTKLIHVTSAGFVARTFLPTIEHVPAEEVSAFIHRLLPERSTVAAESVEGE